jgi:hypothetical protein
MDFLIDNDLIGIFKKYLQFILPLADDSFYRVKQGSTYNN